MLVLDEVPAWGTPEIGLVGRAEGVGRRDAPVPCAIGCAPESKDQALLGVTHQQLDLLKPQTSDQPLGRELEHAVASLVELRGLEASELLKGFAVKARIGNRFLEQDRAFQQSHLGIEKGIPDQPSGMAHVIDDAVTNIDGVLGRHVGEAQADKGHGCNSIEVSRFSAEKVGLVDHLQLVPALALLHARLEGLALKGQKAHDTTAGDLELRHVVSQKAADHEGR